MKKYVKCIFLFALIFLSLNFASRLVIADNNKWYHVWGEKGSEEQCGGIALDSSENIYLGGMSSSWDFIYSKLCLVKYNSSGDYQWNKTISDTWYNGGFRNAITIDASDNIYLSGGIHTLNSSTSDFIFIKFDSSGNYQWNRTWDSGYTDDCNAIALDSLGNIYLAGSSHTKPNNEDFCLVKFDNSGNYLWNRTWGGNSTDRYRDIALDSADNVYLAGETASFGSGGYQSCLVKYNSTGDIQFNTTWGDPYGDSCNSIALDSSENVYLAGSNFVLVKFDNSGNYLWNRTWGGKSSKSCDSMLIDQSGKIYLAGYSGILCCMVAYNNNGSLLWSKSVKLYDGGHATGMASDKEGNIYIGGMARTSYANGYDFLLIKNLQLFTEQQQISGYNPFLLTIIIIGIAISLTTIKFKFLGNKISKSKL